MTLRKVPTLDSGNLIYDQFMPERLSASALATEKAAALVVQSATFAARRVHILLAAGQSNMRSQGVPISAMTDPAHPRIKQWPSAPSAQVGQIIPATEPLAHPDPRDGVGPAFQFARHWIQLLPEDDVILIVPGASGDSGLSTDVENGWRWGVAGNLTARILASTAAAIAAAEIAYPNAVVEVSAVLWVQGEKDAATASATYLADLDTLIAGFRATFETPALPFIMGQMVPEYMTTSGRNAINAVHAGTPYRVAATGFALAQYGYSNSDKIHFSGPGQRLQGRRIFDEFQRVRAGLAPVNAASGVPIAAPLVAASLYFSDIFARTGELIASTPTVGGNWTGGAGYYATDGTRAKTVVDGATLALAYSTLLARPSFAAKWSATVGVSAATATSRITRWYGPNVSSVQHVRLEITGAAGKEAVLSKTVNGSGRVVLATFPAGTISDLAGEYNVSIETSEPAGDGSSIVTAKIGTQTVTATLTAAEITALSANTGRAEFASNDPGFFIKSYMAQSV